MQNKANLLDALMNVKSIHTVVYENKSNWTLGENKPNSNPIKPNFRKAKMNVNLYVTKDYRKKDDFAVRKNKPNSNPISVKPKMNVSLYVIKEYENETAFRLEQNKPNQSQFQRQKTVAIYDGSGSMIKSELLRVLISSVYCKSRPIKPDNHRRRIECHHTIQCRFRDAASLPQVQPRLQCWPRVRMQQFGSRRKGRRQGRRQEQRAGVEPRSGFSFTRCAKTAGVTCRAR